MRPDAAPETIISCGSLPGRVLGEFLPGYGYWVTPENAETVAKVLADGRAYEDDPANAPKLPFNLGAQAGYARAGITVGA
jgi:hypothetical protein